MYQLMNGCMFRIRNSDFKQRSKPEAIIKIKLLHAVASCRSSERHWRRCIVPRVSRLILCVVPKCPLHIFTSVSMPIPSDPVPEPESMSPVVTPTKDCLDEACGIMFGTTIFVQVKLYPLYLLC